MEREPRNNLPIEFAWMNTKDFWQQEQAILAYLILHSVTGKDEPIDPRGASRRGRRPYLKADFLALAREMEAFWNLYFLDHDNRGVYQRVTGNGIPVHPGQLRPEGGRTRRATMCRN